MGEVEILTVRRQRGHSLGAAVRKSLDVAYGKAAKVKIIGIIPTALSGGTLEGDTRMTVIECDVLVLSPTE